MNIFPEVLQGTLIAWHALRANKLRALLTTLGIVIGVMTVALMGSAINGLNQAFRNSLAQLGADVLYLDKFAWGPNDEWWKIRNRRDITYREAQRIAREVTSFRAFSFESALGTNVRYEGRTARGVFTIGNTEDSPLVRGLTLKEGRFFGQFEVAGVRPVCVLGADLAARLFPNESPLGKRVFCGDNRLEVVGTLDKMGQFLFFNLDNQLIMPITYFMENFAWSPSVMMSAKVWPDIPMDEAREELRGAARKIRKIRPGDPDDFAINQQDMILKTFDRIGGMIAAAGLALTGLSLFVGGIGIMNIMFVSVVERTREIGLRKALGAKRRTIMTQFLVESSGLCFLGGAIGLGLAYAATFGLKSFIPASMSWPVVLTGLVVSITTGVVAGYLPARRAAGLSPVEALRHE